MSQSNGDHLFRSMKTAEHLGKTCVSCTDLALETIGARAGRTLRATQPKNTVRRTPLKTEKCFAN